VRKLPRDVDRGVQGLATSSGRVSKIAANATPQTVPKLRLSAAPWSGD
jgi:hypothetical protein